VYHQTEKYLDILQLREFKSHLDSVTDSEMPQERVGGLTTVLKSWQMLGAQKLAVIARSFFRSDERSSTNARDGQIIVPHG